MARPRWRGAGTISITTPNSAATPARAIKPVPVATDRWNPHPVEEPDPAHKGERHAGDNQQCFADAAERQIQQHEDNHQRHRYHQLQLLIGALQQLKLPGVGHTDARLQLHLLADGLLQIVALTDTMSRSRASM